MKATSIEKGLKMNYYFTWHDIEHVLEENRCSWPETWVDVQVYSDCIEIRQNGTGPQESDTQYLKNIFGSNYSVEKNTLRIDFTGACLDIIFQNCDGIKAEKKYAPLFSDISGKKCEKAESDFDGLKMIAFYSYKDGIERTLSLTTFLRQCAEKYPDKRILVVDADMEASGLTWTFESRKLKISFLDVLSIMNYGQLADQEIEKVSNLIEASMIHVTTDEKTIDQYFVPAYRENEQTLRAASRPDQILMKQENKFYITETIAKIAKKLGADLVLMDLQAGITEYAAPFLFDPRVMKYYVTSTSLQSVKGTSMVLEQVYKRTNADPRKSTILLTKIPETMGSEEVQKIKSQLVEKIGIDMDMDTISITKSDETE